MPVTPYSNILIIKPSALGDIIHALPALPALRAAFPNAGITWLVRTPFAPIFECVKEVDRLLLFDRAKMAHWFYKPAAFVCLRDIRRQHKEPRFDLVLDLQGLLRSAIFARMTGCPERIGLAEAREGARLFYTKTARRPQNSAHILDYYFQALRLIGVSAQPADYPLTAPGHAQVSATAKLTAAGLERGRYAVLVPGSAHDSKCWPAERFARAAEYLHRQYHLKIAAVGSAHEKAIIQRIGTHCSIPIADLCGQTSLVELVAVFQQAACVISNDTGPGHIAASAGVPTVLVFGHTNPLRLGPYKRPDCIAAVDMQNRGITVDHPNPAYRIEHVSVEMVVDKIKTQLEKA
jgi:lipopolysaccharide heptosyltransferase I